MTAPGIDVIPGTSSLVLVCPHGGRRDRRRMPWSRGGLRTNDLYTPELTRLLARVTRATAIVNATHDRNLIDLNRIDQALTRCPEFLAVLREVLRATILRHGRATLLTIHGWNTLAPALDLGIGCKPGHELDGPAPGAAASPAFVTGALPTLMDACQARGIHATLGRRYPARAPYNLIQLFTERYRQDARAPFADIAALGVHCNAVQVELGVPLRWPGPRRTALVEAIAVSAEALARPERIALADRRTPVAPGPAPDPSRVAVEFASDDLSGAVVIDRLGARLLLVDRSGTLLVFTRERLRGDRPGRAAGLAVHAATNGLRIRFEGPLAHFPDTAPFADLEHGLAAAALTEADVRLHFVAAHPGCPFGTLAGVVTLADRTVIVRAPAFRSGAERPGSALHAHVDDRRRLVVDASGHTGLLCVETEHHRVRLRSAATADAQVIELDSSATGGRLTIRARPTHRIPVVQGHHRPPLVTVLAVIAISDRSCGWARFPPA